MLNSELFPPTTIVAGELANRISISTLVLNWSAKIVLQLLMAKCF